MAEGSVGGVREMTFKEKARIMDKLAIGKAVMRIAHEILEKNKGTEGLVIVGIRNRGAYLADRITESIKSISGNQLPQGIMDITLYRDDLTQVSESPILKETRIDFDITGKKIILVDDVLYTGRTIRCALDELIDFGRPACIQLAVLVDRGHRELPIRPDYVGRNIPTNAKELIEVRLFEVDGKDEVLICQTE